MEEPKFSQSDLSAIMNELILKDKIQTERNINLALSLSRANLLIAEQKKEIEALKPKENI